MFLCGCYKVFLGVDMVFPGGQQDISTWFVRYIRRLLGCLSVIAVFLLVTKVFLGGPYGVSRWSTWWFPYVAM